MKKIALLIFYFCWQTICFAELTASLDRPQVSLGDSFTLTINTDKVKSYKEPDLTPLHIDFHVLGSSSQQQLQVLNGKQTASKQWHITLSPKQEGRLAIPAITLGTEQTPILEVQVYAPQNAPANVEGHELDVILTEVSAQPGIPFVMEQSVFSVQVFIEAQAVVDHLSLSEPEIQNATAIKLDKDLHYQTTRNGRRYKVIERRYAIFAEQPGPIALKNIELSGSRAVAQKANQHDPYSLFNDPFFASSLFRQMAPFRLPIETLTLDVLPQSPDYPSGAVWLPASNLAISEEWSSEDELEIPVGEPITRTITITAEGLLGSHLPPLTQPDLKGIKAYPNPEQVSTTTTVNGVHGAREETVAYIPSEQGNYTLPAVDLVWWDISAKAVRHATLPARQFTVVTGKSDAQSGSPDALLSEELNALIETNSSWTQYIGWLFAILLALFWGISSLKKRGAPLPHRPNNLKKEVTLQPTAPTPKTQATEQVDSVNEASIKQACLSNDAHLSAKHILAYVKHRASSNNTPAPRSLRELQTFFQSTAPETALALNHLEQIVYQGGSQEWDGALCFRQLKPLFKRRWPTSTSTSPDSSDKDPWKELHM